MKNPITVALVIALLVGIFINGECRRAYGQTIAQGSADQVLNIAPSSSIAAATAPLHAIQIVTTTPVTVTVIGNVGAQPRDYVIIAPAGTPEGKEDTNINPWKYLNDKTGKTNAAPAAGITDAVVNFVISKPGKYEARLYRRLDKGAMFLRAIPFIAELAPLELLHMLECTIVRHPDSSVDALSLTIQSGKCQLVASQSSPVKADIPLINSGP